MIRKTQPDARMVMTKATSEPSTHAAKGHSRAVFRSEQRHGTERRRWNE